MGIFSWLIETLLQWYVWMPLVILLLYARGAITGNDPRYASARKRPADSRNTKGQR